MAGRERSLDVGAARGREILARLTAEGREARLGSGLGQADVAATLGISTAQLSRMERGLAPDLTIDRAARWFAVLGLDLSVRAYPAGDPIRDAAHIALLERLRLRLHPSFRWRTEVPLPIPGDRRAWDATATAPIVRVGIEAETRIRDVQAVDRKVGLKERDGGMDRVVLLVADTRSNRATLRASSGVLSGRFPVDGARALELLAAGVDPGGNSIVVL